MRSQNDQTASENLPKETLPAHHKQKLMKKCFFIFIKIFNLFLPCRLSHFSYHLFLAFFSKSIWRDFYFWADLGDLLKLPRRPSSCSTKNCFAFSENSRNSQEMCSQVFSLFLPPHTGKFWGFVGLKICNFWLDWWIWLRLFLNWVLSSRLKINWNRVWHKMGDAGNWNLFFLN